MLVKGGYIAMKYTKEEWEEFSKQGKSNVLMEIKSRLKHKLYLYGKTEEEKKQIETDILYLSELIRKADDVEIDENELVQKMIVDADHERKRFNLTLKAMLDNARRYSDFEIIDCVYSDDKDDYYFLYDTEHVSPSEIKVVDFFKIANIKKHNKEKVSIVDLETVNQ